MASMVMVASLQDMKMLLCIQSEASESMILGKGFASNSSIRGGWTGLIIRFLPCQLLSSPPSSLLHLIHCHHTLPFNPSTLQAPLSLSLPLPPPPLAGGRAALPPARSPHPPPPLGWLLPSNTTSGSAKPRLGPSRLATLKIQRKN